MTKPTFLRVGVPKTKTRPPTTVRPPTEVGQATLPGVTTCNNKGGVSDPFSAGTDTMPWDLPANRSIGDLVIAVVTHSDSGSTNLSVPSGWTRILDRSHATQPLRTHIIYKVMVGTETTPTTLELTGLTTSDQAAQTSWLIKANGVDLSTNPPEADSAEGQNSLDVDPPTISPTSGDGVYFVFAGGFGTQAVEYPPPSGYTALVDCAWANSNTMFQAYQVVDITTSEDPGQFTPSGGDITDWWMAWTIAVKQSQGSAPVAGGDHTHALGDASDVTTGTPTKGNLLVGDGDSWEVLGVGSDGQVVKADSAQTLGVKWAAESGGSSALDDLTDVTITGTPADNEVVAYDSGTSEFINQTAAEAGLAAATHTHTESDVTDLDHWTEADHDALDHTGLTGVGAGGGEILVSDTPSTPLVFADLLQNEAQDDLIYSD